MSENRVFTGIERRRNPGLPGDRREAGEVAVFHELGKALTSSLQLDQVLRTIMEKIDEFLHPDTWSMLLVDEVKQELYFELAIGKNAHGFADYGNSMIIDPWGKVIARAADKECFITAEIDRDYLEKVRKELPCLTHRRL